MPRDLDREIKILRNRMTDCFQETLLARDLRPAVFLAVLGLHLTLDRLSRARDPAKRLALIQEFDRGQAAVRRILDRAYRETKIRPPQLQRNHQDQRAA